VVPGCLVAPSHRPSTSDVLVDRGHGSSVPATWVLSIFPAAPVQVSRPLRINLLRSLPARSPRRFLRRTRGSDRGRQK
jgi:hypothetical protein